MCAQKATLTHNTDLITLASFANFSYHHEYCQQPKPSKSPVCSAMEEGYHYYNK
jgi:hypothetical protein